MEKIQIFFLFLFLSISKIYEKEFSNKENINKINEPSICEQNLDNDYNNYVLKDIYNRSKLDLEGGYYRFINDNPELIYIFESNLTDIIINYPQNNGFKNINVLEYGSNLTIDNYSPENIYISSIPKKNIKIELLFTNNYDKHYLKQVFSNIKIIETKENNLILTFDSFDEYHEVLYAKYENGSISPQDIYLKNNAKFHKINIKEDIITLYNHSTYIIKNEVNEFYFSSLEMFITQQQKNQEEEIILNERDEKYLYLNKDKTYTIKLNNISNYRIMKLSSKTRNSKITMNDNIILDKEKIYYELEMDKTLNLKIENADALIEFLYYLGNEKVINSLEIYKEKIDEYSNGTLIKLGSPDDYIVKLESNLNKAFGASIYGKFGKGNYHYYSEECQKIFYFGFTIEETIKRDLYQNINYKNEESFMVYINVYKEDQKQSIYLSIYSSNLNISKLNAANFTYIDIDPQTTYKFIIENDNEYNFKVVLEDKNNKESYYPIYTLENGTNYNDLEISVKNEGNNKNTPVYVNYNKNWPKDKKVQLIIVADEAYNILKVIYIISSIFILICFVIVIFSLRKLVKNAKNIGRDSSEGKDELINKVEE